ncbi:protein KIAA0100 [Nephila pilipes]|uniref:Protein KIAA0100 n=1 Tax=Nephila pilipes TaxID=299642 RepID=A0A8X6MYH1_NEPPI|nr:protein KIAA0100 [Nephila pilipes]
MDYQNFLLIPVVGIIIIIIFLRFGVKVLSWFLHRKFGVKLKVGGYGIMCFRNIHLQLKNGLKLEIEYIGVSSCLLNSNLKSIIVICLNDIRLQGDADWIMSRKPSSHQDDKNSSGLPVKFVSFLKFISLNVSNASVMQLGKSAEEFLLHLSFHEFNLYCCRLKERIQLNMTILSSSVKVFKHLSIDQEKPHSTESCICHFASNLHFSIETTFNKIVEIESFFVNISEPELMLYEGFSVLKFKNYALNGLHTKKQSDNQEVNNSDLLEGNDETISVEETVQENYMNIKNKLKKIPKVSNISIDSFSVKVMMKGGHRIFNFGVNFISLHVEVGEFHGDEILPAISSKIEIKEITAASDHVQFGRLVKCGFEFKASEKLVDLNFNLSVLHILYQKEVLQCFLNALFFNNKKMKLNYKPKVQRKRSLNDLLNGCKIKTSVDVDDICISFEMPECEKFCFGLIKGQSSLEHFLCSKSTHIISSNSSPSTGSSFELLLETAFLKLGDTSISDYGMLKRYHYSYIPVFIGMILLKVRYNQLDCCVESMVDGCHLQWCPESSQLLLYLLSYAKKSFSSDNVSHTETFINQPSITESSNEGKSKVLYHVELNFRGLNIFCMNVCKTGVLMRTDLLKLSLSNEKAKILFEGFKLSYLNTLLKVYFCVRSSEIKNYDMFVEDASVIYLLKPKDVTIRISENMYVNWSTTLHMTILTVAQECIAFKKNLIVSSAENKNSPEISSIGISEPSIQDNKKSSKTFSICLQANGHLDFGIVLSKNHRMLFSSSEISFTYKQQFLSANSDQLVVAFDNHEIFTFEIPIAPDEVHKTAIWTPFGLFESSQVQFGLCNASSTFQRFIDEVTRGMDGVYAFIDDILIVSRSYEKHLEHLQALFSSLDHYGRTIKLSKCTFGIPTLDFLGFTVSEDGHTNRKKSLRPTAVSEPSLQWSEEAEKSFTDTKKALAEATLLKHPIPGALLSLWTDASDVAIGNSLMQLCDDKREPIAFLSMKLNKSQRNWSTYGHELYAIYASIKKFHHMLEG